MQKIIVIMWISVSTKRFVLKSKLTPKTLKNVLNRPVQITSCVNKVEFDLIKMYHHRQTPGADFFSLS